jgi:phosphoribosylaminoimidazole (AIR) synthetase
VRNSAIGDIVVLGIRPLLLQLYTCVVHIDVQMANERRQYKIEKAGKGDTIRSFSGAFWKYSYR